MFNKLRIEGNTEEPNTIDHCVCHAYIGAVFVGTTNRIFIRVDESDPCSADDWLEITNADSTAFTFAYVGDTGVKVVNNQDTLILNGINGFTVSIAGSTFTMDGHLYSSNSAPVSPPIEAQYLSMHINTTNNNIYAWNPTLQQWVLIKTAETITTLVNNGNGTYTYTSENGTQTTFGYAEKATTLVNNNNGSFTYTNELNNTSTIDILSIINQYADVGVGLQLTGNTLELLDGQGQIISSVALPANPVANETITTLVDNEDGTYTYTNENGDTVTFNANDIITSLVYNAQTGTLTYTNETGVATNIQITGAGGAMQVDPASTFGANYLVKNLTITQNGLLLEAGAEHLVSTSKNSNSVITQTPIPTSADDIVQITMDLTNPSATRTAKAQLVFTGFPIDLKTSNSSTTTLVISQSILINNVTPSDYTNQPSRFKLSPNSEITAITQGYSTTVDLNPGQTIQVVITIDIFTE